MTDSAFSVTDRKTWPEVLTLAEVAAILRKGIEGLRRQASERTCVPAPFLRGPVRWRKADVVRYLDGSPISVSTRGVYKRREKVSA